ncbi:hypothetical protein MNBD_GAMMA01-2229 [hydrothermal vent metagenome]|uniref:Uncharacterized protein n=1 Tax=hydrothermal vent metagenome TaxID=652676 RepID=A0A3B0VNP4_9ZZZZ
MPVGAWQYRFCSACICFSSGPGADKFFDNTDRRVFNRASISLDLLGVVRNCAINVFSMSGLGFYVIIKLGFPNRGRIMKIVLISLYLFFLMSCASTLDNDYTNAKSKTQCPIGYHLEQNNPIEIYNSDKDTSRKTTIEFNCVADSDKKMLHR